MRKPSFFFAIGLLGVGAPAQAASRATLLNMTEVFTADDYPAVAQSNGQEGDVVVLVEVDKAGLATSCRVKRSSGYASLDEQTCALFRARARFEPARDGRGRTVASTFEKRVVWRLEGDPPQLLSRQAWLVRVTLSFDSAGTIVACKAEGVGTPPLDGACPTEAEKSGAAPPSPNPAAEAITETYFYPVAFAAAKLAADRTDATKVGQQVSAVDIDADGRVSRCEGMRYTGTANPDMDVCSATSTMRFVPGSALSGTIVVTAYLRQHSVT